MGKTKANQGHGDESAIPPDNGRRASVDPKTGEVHGSGAGAGGGNPGEDFASDSAAGEGFPYTANLVRFIKSARSVVPDNAMPDQDLTDAQARNVAAYLMAQK